MTVTLSWEKGKIPEPATSASCEPPRIAPNPFPERRTALRASTTLNKPIITNNLDEQQQCYSEENERARRPSQTLAIAEAHSDYRFNPLSVDELFAGQPLTIWPTGREASTSDDIAERGALREREILDARSDDDLRVPNRVDGTSTWCLCTDAENDPGRSIPR